LSISRDAAEFRITAQHLQRIGGQKHLLQRRLTNPVDFIHVGKGCQYVDNSPVMNLSDRNDESQITSLALEME
jgi:hypothetical protein